MGLLKCDHIKRLITLTSDNIKRLSLYFQKNHLCLLFQMYEQHDGSNHGSHDDDSTESVNGRRPHSREQQYSPFAVKVFISNRRYQKARSFYKGLMFVLLSLNGLAFLVEFL